MMKAIYVALALLLLTACGYNPNAPTPYDRYYVGTQGVTVSFDNVPSQLYYYGPGDAANTFTFGAQIMNKGASFTRGGVYLSGFDPHLIAIDGMHISGVTPACGISIGNIGFGELGGIFHCDDLTVTAGNGGVRTVNIDSLRTLIQGIGQRFDKSWWQTSNFDLGVSYSQGPNGNNFIINMKNPAGQIDYFQHGRLFIALFANLDFRINQGREFLLAGNTVDFPGGEYDYETYNAHIIDWPQGSDTITQHLALTSCYQYTTFADPIVCIDPEPTSDNRKVCIPQSRTWGGGNGAPVSITSVEQENTPRKIIFHINVRNSGNGDVIDPGKLEKCSPYYPQRLTPADKNVVYLGDVRIGNTGLQSRGGTGGITCSPEVIRLDPISHTGSTTCTYSLDTNVVQSRSAYETPLVVELWYGYSQYLQRDITIKRV